MVSPFITEKFDIGMLRADGTTKVGLMLRKGRNEIPAWQVFDDEYLAQQFFSDDPGYGALPAEKELAIIRDDWRAGLGLEIYDATDPRRYHKSTMDMRFRGMGIAGWKSSTVTLPTGASSSASLANTDFELSASWTNGSRSGIEFHGGTYSWFVSDDSTEAYQDATTWVANWQSKIFTFGCWIWSDTASKARIGINDGVSTTYSSWHTGDSVWAFLTVTKTLDAAATRLRAILDGDTAGYHYFDDAVICSPIAGAIKSYSDFNDLLYIGFGTMLCKMNGSGDTFTVVMCLPAAITDFETMTISSADYLFIAIGTSTDNWYINSSEVAAQMTATVKRFKYFKRVDAAAPTMWGTDGNNTMRSTTNPLNGGTAWSGQTTVDAVSNVITGLHTKSGSLYISKEDTMYYLDSTGAVQNDLAPELTALTRSTDNGKNTGIWLNNVYMPWGNQSLLEEDSGINTWRSPSLSATNAAEYNGQVFAVVGDDQYLYAILDNTTKIEVLAGRLETIAGATGWVWHCINETTLTGCETAFISTVYQKRLWIASTLSTESLYYIPLPLGYADIAADTNRSFLTGTTFETPWLHSNFKNTTKAFIKLTVTMGHTYNTGRYFTAKYKKLGDSGWTTIGNYTGSTTSMTQSRYIPADASSNNPKSTMFKLQFTAVTDDTTITPILHSYYLAAVLYPDQREIIACTIYCANEIQLKDGTFDRGSYDAIIATLDEARTATWPVTIYDVNNVTTTVKFLPLPSNVPRWKIIGNEKERKLELEYNLLMQKVALS